MIALHNQRGFTLIEMLIAIVVLAAAVTGIFAAFSQNAGKSADPMIRQQAISIAQAYLEEAILKPYSEPDPLVAETGGCEAGETRILYDDVADYGCIIDNAGAVDQFGNALVGLGNYNIVVNVSTVNIGAPAITTRQVVVTVTHDQFANMNMSMTAYRAAYY